MIPEFIQEYFVDPIKYGEGYNWINTLTYGIILVIASYAVYTYLRNKITMDRHFYYSVGLFVLVGGSARVVKDMGVSESYILVTPLIFFLIFAITFISLVVLVKWKGEKYYTYLAAEAVVLFCVILGILAYNAEAYNWKGLLYIVATAVSVTVLVYYISKYMNLQFITRNIEIMGGHMLDASATSFGLAMFGYFEQHMLPGMLIRWFDTPFVMFPLKIVVVGAALSFIEDIEDEGYKNFIRLIILILGAAPGLRDVLRIFFLT
ncbi:MAG: DUF63 family protein [Theionarchaea archaeon]|nr:DUF63 family protein [Theionarchaea archaeon]MBU6999515.1 DUF63 family protein [Theionarchaea archaeon]MBU7035792.1 DUF63 family protein [Theionarchaea archaeon]